jgi:hypothetical protein
VPPHPDWWRVFSVSDIAGALIELFKSIYAFGNWSYSDFSLMWNALNR